MYSPRPFKVELFCITDLMFIVWCFIFLVSNTILLYFYKPTRAVKQMLRISIS